MFYFNLENKLLLRKFWLFKSALAPFFLVNRVSTVHIIWNHGIHISVLIHNAIVIIAISPSWFCNDKIFTFSQHQMSAQVFPLTRTEPNPIAYVEHQKHWESPNIVCLPTPTIDGSCPISAAKARLTESQMSSVWAFLQQGLIGTCCITVPVV